MSDDNRVLFRVTPSVETDRASCVPATGSEPELQCGREAYKMPDFGAGMGLDLQYKARVVSAEVLVFGLYGGAEIRFTAFHSGDEESLRAMKAVDARLCEYGWVLPPPKLESIDVVMRLKMEFGFTIAVSAQLACGKLALIEAEQKWTQSQNP